MTIMYQEVQSHLAGISKDLKYILTKLDDIMVEARDDHGVPIYLTKCRVKSCDSTFLKVRRQRINDLEEITDYAGIRVLCLFEQDILDIHKHIIETLTTQKFKIHEFKIFNWTHERYVRLLTNVVVEKCGNIPMPREKRDSGYKSIHYIGSLDVGGKDHFFEIQLRTLLQDVWGELEHSLAYKRGNIHPHIKKSFSLLARDLETNDSLMAHLKNISAKQRLGELYSVESAGPHKYFGYENELIPELFLSDEVKPFYDEYTEFVRGTNARAGATGWIEKAKKLYEQLCAKITVSDGKDKKVKYFVGMEDAFFKFCEGKYEDAIKIYVSIKNDYENYYCPYFRMGEIFFIQGDIVRALASFDRSEELLSEDDPAGLENKYRIKVKLAYTYWLLGSEYIDFAIEQINEAERLFTHNRLLFDKNDSFLLTNAVCWYYLEKYILSQDENDYRIVREKFGQLEGFLVDPEAPANLYDTAAWFHYHSYCRDGNPKSLQDAKDCCQEIGARENPSTYKLLSHNIQRNHILEIMNTK